MRPMATELVAWSVCVFVCVRNGEESCKTAEPIEMPFGMWVRMGPSNHVLDRSVESPPGEGEILEAGKYGHAQACGLEWAQVTMY